MYMADNGRGNKAALSNVNGHSGDKLHRCMQPDFTDHRLKSNGFVFSGRIHPFWEALTLRRLTSYIYGAPILDVSRSHTTTQHIRQDSSGRVISSSQRPLPDNTRHSQQTNIHALGGIRTHDISRRAAADLRLRRRGQWDRRFPG